MRGTVVFVYCLALGLNVATGIAADSREAQKKDEKKGLTMEDLGRGLKGAEQNIEKEIPKIGPAIGETIKKLGGKKSDKESDQKPSKQGK